MDEYVLAFGAKDKAETFFGIEPFDLTICHDHLQKRPPGN